MHFSKRSELGLATNAIADTLRRAQRAKATILDLSQSNPTRCGLACDASTLALLGDARGRDYQPRACGLLEARMAVASYYANKGADVAVDNILLTASTSEAYRLVFDLLCDPGDTVLLPRPAYPLLSMLAQLGSLEVETYGLIREDEWRPDWAQLEAQLKNPAVRVLTLVHPANPMGSYFSRPDAERLAHQCEENGVSLVVDEVFVDYPMELSQGERIFSFTTLAERGLCFVLSGLSKVAMLPQLKLSWLVARGRRVKEAMGRLELMADTFLSLATPVQLALPSLLQQAPAMRARVLARLVENLATLDRLLEQQEHPGLLRRLPVAAGWYAMLEIPRTRSDDAWVVLGIEAGFYVHPGYFYDINRQGIMVVSLLTEPSIFLEGLRRAIVLWGQEN